MIKLINEIWIIKNKATQIGQTDPQLNQELSVNFVIPSETTGIFPIQKEEFQKMYESGQDVYLKIPFATNIEIERTFTKLSATAKFTIPRNLNWGGIDNMVNNEVFGKGKSSVFGRGDRVVIKCGYESETKGILKEVFKGYITAVGVSTPLTIECEDMMFFLKNMQVQYDYWNDKKFNPDAAKLWTNDGKLTLENLIKRIFLYPYNNLLMPNQISRPGTGGKPLFKIVKKKSEINSEGGIQYNIYQYIPIYLPNDLNTDPTGKLNSEPLSFVNKNQKNVAEVLQDIKTKLHIYPYFDDFGNLHFELPFLNLNTIDYTHKNFYLPGGPKSNVIDDHNLVFMNQDEKPIKVIMSSKQTSKGGEVLYADGPTPELIKKLGLKGIGPNTKKFVGNALGDSITVTSFDNIKQEELDKYALLIWRANTYQGYRKGSKFTTFGNPTMYIGQSVRLISNTIKQNVGTPQEKEIPQFPEKEGDFAIVGIKRIFGINGYRQEIEIGPKLNPKNNG